MDGKLNNRNPYTPLTAPNLRASSRNIHPTSEIFLMPLHRAANLQSLLQSLPGINPAIVLWPRPQSGG